VRSAAARHLGTALAILCIQAMATMLTFRRDPVERFEGAVATALTWEAVRRLRIAERAER
jgi:hypothetical protein